jgi:protein ImuB
MSVSAALALASKLRATARDAHAERHALERLAAWAGQYSSLVHVEAPATLLLEVGGSVTLFRGLTNLLARVEFGVAELGYTARPGLAPTRLAATWFARAGQDAPVTDIARLPGALAELPLEVLDLSPAQLVPLHGMGLTRVGDCLRLERASLARRLGPAFVIQIDRALGRVPDPRRAYVPPASFESRLELPAPVENVESLTFALNRLLAELCGELRARSAGVMNLTLTLVYPKAAAVLVELGLLAPTREPRHLIELFRERLARLELAEPVEALVLRAASYLPLGTPTLDLFGVRPGSGESAATLIERLRARLGQQAVEGLHCITDHRPERAHGHGDSKPAMPAVEVRGERPVWLLPEPLPLEQDGDAPRLDSVLELEGEAERIESGWWDGGDIARDYFVAHTRAGECYWIFRDRRAPRRWWLHGIFG